MSDENSASPIESRSVVSRRRYLNKVSMFALIITSALLSVLYVWNVIKVNTLLREVGSLEKSSDSLASANEALRVEIARLESPERITRIAQKMGLTSPTQAPVVIQPPVK